MAIEWFETYEIGIKEIDQQHKYFVGILNELYLSCRKNKAGHVDQVIDELLRYSEAHFNTEEKYFDKFRYEFAGEHKTEHNKIRAKIAEFVAIKDKEKIGDEVLDFMENWLHEHLVQQDQKFVKCFTENGVK